MDDDARRRTVALVSDTPEHVLDRAHTAAAAGRDERAADTGQIELTDAEKNRLGPFSGSNNYRKAAAAKAVFRSEGVDDWTAFYDAELTVDEHRDLAARAKREENGKRRDAEETEDARLGAAEKAVSKECDHARGHCEHGDSDACEFLQEACGFEEDAVADLLDDDSPTEETEIDGAAAGALGRAWNGYKAGISALAGHIEGAQDAQTDVEGAAAAINAIRADHGQEPLEFERLEELSDDLAATGRTAHDGEAHVEARGEFVDDRGDDQAQLDVPADVREAQGQETRADVEAATEFGADDRGEPSRGAARSAPESEQRQFRDPEQDSL